MIDNTEARPEALRLADLYTAETWPGGLSLNQWALSAATELRRQHAEIERLRALAATCYAGLGGECDLPVIWLDALSDAANGEPFDTDGLLPYTSAIRAQLVAQTNRAASAEQQVTALTQRLDMANRLNTDAREQLAQLSARQAAPDAIGHVRIDSGEVHIYPRKRDAESSGLLDGQLVYAAAPPPPEQSNSAEFDGIKTPPSEREPLSQHDLERLVGNWFAEGWAKKAAFGMLDDYELTRNRSHQ